MKGTKNTKESNDLLLVVLRTTNPQRLCAPQRFSESVVVVSPCHPVTLSPCHLVTLSPCLAGFGCGCQPRQVLRGYTVFFLAGPLFRVLALNVVAVVVESVQICEICGRSFASPGFATQQLRRGEAGFARRRLRRGESQDDFAASARCRACLSTWRPGHSRRCARSGGPPEGGTPIAA